MPSSLPFPCSGVDYSDARPNLAELRNLGYRFVGRYVGSPAPKGLTPSEATAIHGHGLHILLFYESTAGRAAEGQHAGIVDGETASNACKGLHVPRDIVVYFTVDMELTSADSAAVQAYLEGARAQLNARGYHAGVYGGYETLPVGKAAGVEHLVQTVAWSGGRWYALASVWQNEVNVTIAGGDCDHLRALRPFGGWAP